MGTIISGILRFFRNFFKSLGGALFGASVTDENGDSFWKGQINPKKFRLFLFGIFIAGAFGVAMHQMFKDSKIFIKGVEDFKEEQGNDLGIYAQETEYEFDGIDPMADLRFNEQDLFPRQQQPQDPNNPNYLQCQELYNKFKSGVELTEDELKTFNICINNNLLSLSPEERDAIRNLMKNDGLSVLEQQMLKDLFKENPSCMKEIDSQKQTPAGKNFLDILFSQEQPPTAIIDLLSQQKMLTLMQIDPEKTRQSLEMSPEYFAIFQTLLDQCGSDFLKRLMTDPKLRALLDKLIKNKKSLQELLEDPNLTEEEKQLIKDYLSGKLSGEDEDLLEALLSSDPIKRKLAKDALKARALGDMELAEALRKKALGLPLTDREKELLKRYNENPDLLSEAYAAKMAGNDALAQALLKKLKGEKLSPEELKLLNAEENPLDGLSEREKIEALAKGIVDDQNKLNDLNDAINRAQEAARLAAEKIKNNQPLTKEETDALNRLTKLLNERDALLADMKKRQSAYTDLLRSMQGSIDRSAITVKQVNPYLEGEDGYIDCKDLKPLQIVKIKKPKKKVRKKRKTTYVDANGNPISAEQVRLLQLLKKKQSESDNLKNALRDALRNPLASDLNVSRDGLISSASIANSANQKGREVGIDAVFANTNNAIAQSPLTPDMKIPAVSLVRVLISDKDPAPSEFKAKILANVLDPATSQIVIPKGSIAIGTIGVGSFSVPTRSVNITLDRIVLGKGKVIDNIPLSVGSADNTPSLKGQVYDTRTEQLLGAFATAFTQGALAAIQQTYITDFNDSDLISDQLIGAGIGGGVEIARVIQENFVQDMQNAPRVFYAPANIKLVLTPQ